MRIRKTKPDKPKTTEQAAKDEDVKARVASIQTKQADLKQLQESLQEEAAELLAIQRKTVMEEVKSVSLSTAELDAFVSGFDGVKGKHELGIFVLKAGEAAKLDTQQLQYKLIRMGIL